MKKMSQGRIIDKNNLYISLFLTRSCEIKPDLNFIYMVHFQNHNLLLLYEISTRKYYKSPKQDLPSTLCTDTHHKVPVAGRRPPVQMGQIPILLSFQEAPH